MNKSLHEWRIHLKESNEWIKAYMNEEYILKKVMNESKLTWMNTYIYPCRMLLSQPKPLFSQHFGSM